MKKLVFIFLFIQHLCFAQTNQSLIIHNIHIVDVEKGRVIDKQAVKISNGKIESIAPLKKLNSKNSQIIDGKDNYLIPGLWDMHVHLEGENLVDDNLALFDVFLAHGITTVRDAASDLGEQVLKWRDEINADKIVGPTIYTAGRKLEGLNSIWKGDLEISNEAELEQMLQKIDNYHVDFVKITENTLDGALFLKSVIAAKKRGYLVSGHVPVDLPIATLANAGFSSIEHASYVLRLGNNEAEMIKKLQVGDVAKNQVDNLYFKNFDQNKAIEGYKMLAEKNVAVCPTLIGGKQLAYLDENNHKNDDFLKYLTKRFVANYQWRIDRMANETAEQKQIRKDKYQLIAKQVPLMQQAGVLIIAGSDAAALNTFVYPAASLIEELQLFQKAGMKPLHILQSATINGAKFMKKYDEVGSISVGKRADLVLLNQNPLEDIKAIENIQAVIKKGVFFDKNTLENMLKKAAEKKVALDKSRND